MQLAHRRPTNWRPYAALIVGVFVVSTSSALIRLAQSDGAPSLGIAAWRLTLAALILTPIAWTRARADLRRVTRAQLGLAIASGAFLAVHFATWITSLEYTSVINSVVLVTMHPIFVALISGLVLRERVSRLTWVGVALALTGSVIISAAGSAGSAPVQGQALLGDVLALIGALAVTGYFLIGRKVRAALNVLPYIWITYSSAAVFLILFALLTGASRGLIGLPTSAYVWMTLLALLPQLLGHTLYNFALGYVSAAYTSLSILGEPIGSTLIAIPLFGETPVPAQIGGAALILIALIVAGREESRKVARQPDQRAYDLINAGLAIERGER